MSTLTTIQVGVTIALVVVGSFFLLVGTIGLLRLPNVYNRLHATSKATTLGASSMFLAATVHFGPQKAGLTSLVGILFLFATAPTGGHVISRAAQKMGVPFEAGATWPEVATGTDDGGAEAPAEDATDDPDVETDESSDVDADESSE